MQSGSASGRFLWALSTMGFVIFWIGLTFAVGALAIVLVRSYIVFGERAADILGPDMDTTPTGLASVALEIALGPGVHRRMGGIALGLSVCGVTLFACRVAATWAAKRSVARQYARIAGEMKRSEK